ncbi:MAG: caspase family protein, partial [Verrucomicrobiales bacterium]|nr:caspase family protein [Verrucomicrobiales bacterium]
LWGLFKPGVRIFVLSDSCHSGTVTRQMPAFPASGPAPRIRLLPPKQAAKVYRQNAELYDGIQDSVPAGEKGSVRASVILISGCQDNQFSLDGTRNGLFTETLKKIWRKGRFSGSYKRFRNDIAQKMPAQQTPNYTLVGRPNPVFEAQKPFAL